ncbi:MAG TPA: lipopolysaccharide biosynthesis protein [Anaerolineae bacterium]|nr:lipopolysaccharide biosynthesis protein [Anaerolineae bacterium]HIQ04924.1 lipopolysaccharide biosynthesis protein [Anaerolineae bacterium]
MSVTRKITSGIFWVAASTAASRAFSFAATLVLAKLLVPEDFGLVQTAFLALESLQLLRELGFAPALIYRKQDVLEAADATFFITLATTVVYFTIAFVGAPQIALLFKEPRVTSVLRALSFTLIISAMGRVHGVMLARELDFRRRALPEILPALANGIVAVVLAWQGFGVWSLVWGKLTEAGLGALLLWVVTPWRPGWTFNRRVAQELFDYGKHIVGSQILIFFITNVDDAFVMRLLGAAALGVYGLAYRLSNLPATQITRLVNQVMFPAFSRLQDDMEAFRRTYFQAVHYVSLLSIPVSIVTIFFAADFITVLDADKWGEAVVPIRWLAIYGLLRSVAGNMGNVFKAGGKPQWLTGIALWRLTTMVLFLYPVTVRYGVVGVSALSGVVAIVDFFISAYLANKVIHAPMTVYAYMLGPILSLAVAGTWLGQQVQQLLIPAPSIPSLLLGGTLSVLFYVILMLAYDVQLRRLVGRLLTYAVTHRPLQVRRKLE